MGTPDPARLGATLRSLRRSARKRRHQVAAVTGIPSRDLAAFERGRAYPSNRQLDRLADAYAVAISDLIPPRAGVSIDFKRNTLRVSSTVRILGDPATSGDDLLREYLTLLRAMRGSADGPLPLRADDLDALARALGGTPERIEARLVELMGISPGEAVRLRERITAHTRPVVGT